jgi:hypothetical protein
VLLGEVRGEWGSQQKRNFGGTRDGNAFKWRVDCGGGVEGAEGRYQGTLPQASSTPPGAPNAGGQGAEKRYLPGRAAVRHGVGEQARGWRAPSSRARWRGRGGGCAFSALRPCGVFRGISRACPPSAGEGPNFEPSSLPSRSAARQFAYQEVHERDASDLKFRPRFADDFLMYHHVGTYRRLGRESGPEPTKARPWGGRSRERVISLSIPPSSQCLCGIWLTNDIPPRTARGCLQP